MFDPKVVIEQTADFDICGVTPLTRAQLDYAQFYGTHFTKDTPTIRQQMGHFNVGDHRLFAQSWEDTGQPPKGTLLIIHGYMDHMGLYTHVIKYGLSRGLKVVGFDLPGHGLSSGKAAAIDDFLIYQQVLCAWLNQCQVLLPTPYHTIGQSTGGAIIMDYVLTNRFSESNNPLGKLALYAPLVRPAHWYKIRFMHWALTPFTRQVARDFKGNTNSPQFNAFLSQKDALQSRYIQANWVGAMFDYVKRFDTYDPVTLTPLIIQGTLDQTVDFKHNIEAIRKKFKKPEILYLEGAMHHLANEVDRYQHQIQAHLDRWFNLSETSVLS